MENPPLTQPAQAPNQPVGIVLIGDEESVEPYLRTLTRLDRARVIGHLDHPGSSGDAHGSLPSTADPTTAAEWADVDAFIVCCPLADDSEFVAVVAASGKPVFVDALGGRHRADARTVRACIETGEIGRVVFARFAAGGPGADAAGSGGAQLLWQGRDHALDMLGWWIGAEPETVFGQRTLDYESVTVHYADGATAVCDISADGPTYREIVVVGTSASMTLTWADHTSTLLPADGTEAQYADGSGSLDVVLDTWLERVLDGTAPELDASEIATAVALQDAVKRSIDSRREADVKSSRNGSRA